MKFSMGYVDKDMTIEQERDLAIKILHNRHFWLENTFCVVCSIERNDYHYFINFEDRIGANVPRKNIIVSQLKENKDE